MKCYALATRFGVTPLNWVVPGKRYDPHRFFAENAISKWQQQMSVLCDNINSGEEHFLQKDNYYFFIKKVGEDCCIVASDCELSEKQMNFLSYYLLKLKLDLNTVASDIEKYTQDQKIEDLKTGLAETEKMMLGNLDLLIERGGKIEELLDKTEALSMNSVRFKQKAEKINSCWPSCSLF